MPIKKIKSIGIITCWYGDYPWYFPYFIYSCIYNPTVDFIIITDNLSEIPNKPDNVKIVFKTIDEIKSTATAKLGFEVNIDYPYKLCDFKPTYGFIFSDIVGHYDFWGHGDIDLVYGNIRDFMTEELLDNYDVISSRHDYITGSFALFKNNKFINTLFMDSAHYKLVLGNPTNFCFDECSFLFFELKTGKTLFDFPDRVQSMTYVVQKAQKENRLKAYFDFIILEGLPGGISWDKGTVIFMNEYKALFYHLIAFKNVCKNRDVNYPIPEKFNFTTDTILTNIEE